ncbi:hypothetical protein E2C01_091086 [Portunus trituberculatus]|uniref:Uncharacterized protein n=1 Tax=Portunus trituberculatus TaxID=210409 RepID=A0A5B7JRU7_PORTR|nr:hypothetical protein [Portunus trituberculatus]
MMRSATDGGDSGDLAASSSCDFFSLGFQSFFDTTETFSKSFDVQATNRFFFFVSLLLCFV